MKENATEKTFIEKEQDELNLREKNIERLQKKIAYAEDCIAGKNPDKSVLETPNEMVDIEELYGNTRLLHGKYDEAKAHFLKSLEHNKSENVILSGTIHQEEQEDDQDWKMAA